MKENARWFLTLLLCMSLACSRKSDTEVATGPPPPEPGPPPVLTTKKPHFYVDGSTLRDSSGAAFVMRGNNFPVIWFPNDYKPSLSAAASLGCNAARLVWQVNAGSWQPQLATLDEAIALCIAHKMVPIVELHDFTGGTSNNDIITATGFYASDRVKTILDKYSSFLIINIANEWGSGNTTPLAWQQAYLPAIRRLRDAGYKIPIMIDAPGYGQSETAIVAYGNSLLEADPEKNILFSTHAYSNWNDASTYEARIDNILVKNLCFVFGEFGWNVPDNQQPADFVCKVDAPLLMQLCQSKKVGYLGWSWKGNNADNACFDMCASWSDTSKLTTWGRLWAYDPNGVKNTGVKAAAFR